MKQILWILSELKNTNLLNAKKEILNKQTHNEEFKKFLYYTLNPFYKYWVSIDNIDKYINTNKNKWLWIEYDNIYELLDNLRLRTITWHAAIESIILFLENKNNLDEEKEILKIILNKDLNANIWISVINKLFVNPDWKKLIPTFKVSLATKMEEIIKKGKTELDFDNNNYMASRKLDWVRTIAIFNDDWTDIKFYSRQWNEFLTLNVLKEQFLKLLKDNPIMKDFVFDWEVCIINNNGIEDFKQVVGDIKKKDFTIKNPKYLLFDMIKKEDFFDEQSNMTFIERYNNLSSLKFNNKEQKNIIVLEHINNIDIKKFNELMDHSRKLWWEGLILREGNAPYEWKRTKNMIKVKDFKDQEFTVIRTVNGVMPILIDWKMIETEVLSSVEIEYKWNIVNVWSWFSQEERIDFYKNPNKIIGKNITVKYFEETQDKDGKYSLRFPVYIWIRNYE